MRDDVRHTTTLVAGGVATAVLTLAYSLGVGRLLGPAAYGDFSAAMSIFYFLAVAVSPLTPTTARLVTRYRVRNEPQRVDALERAVIRRVVIWSALLAVPMLAATIPVTRAFRFSSPATVVLAFASTILFTTVSIRRGVLQGLTRFREHVTSTVLEAAVRLVGAIVVLQFVRSPAAALVSYVAALLLADLLLRRRTSAPGAADWAEIRELAAPMFVAMIGIAVYQNADVLAVKRWFPAATAGQYGAASALARSVSVLFVPIYTLAGPLLTDLHERGIGLRAATLRLCAYFVALAAVPTLVFALAGDRVVALLYGAPFAPAGGILIALAAVPVVTYLSLIIGQALITVHDRTFAPLYLGFAIVQVVALVAARESISAIILSLYAVQGALLVVMLLSLARLKPDQSRC